jgi:hypothetical protein
MEMPPKRNLTFGEESSQKADHRILQYLRICDDPSLPDVGHDMIMLSNIVARYVYAYQ